MYAHMVGISSAKRDESGEASWISCNSREIRYGQEGIMVKSLCCTRRQYGEAGAVSRIGEQ